MAYDYLRNGALNLKNTLPHRITRWFKISSEVTLGGPIVRNKAFVFGSYEGLRISTPTLIFVGGQILRQLPPRPWVTSGSALPGAKQPKVSCNGMVGVICPNLLDPVARIVQVRTAC